MMTWRTSDDDGWKCCVRFARVIAKEHACVLQHHSTNLAISSIQQSTDISNSLCRKVQFGHLDTLNSKLHRALC